MNSLIRWTELNKLLICLSSDFPNPPPNSGYPYRWTPSQHLGPALPSSLGHVETLQKVEAPVSEKPVSVQAAALSTLKAETRPPIIMSRTAPREPVIRWAHTLKVGGKLVRGQCTLAQRRCDQSQ